MPTEKPETLSTFEFFAKFPNEEAARKFFEEKRWGDEPVCGHCGSVHVTECKGHKPMPYRCKDCRKHFSVRTGTVLAESRLPLQKWLLAIFMLTSARKGIASTQMARELGVTQKTAWFLAQRIRETWLKSRDDDMDGEVQVDETYFGGKVANRHAADKTGKRGPADKAVVLGMRAADGRVIAQAVSNTRRATLKAFITTNAKPGTTVVTDQFARYTGLQAMGYPHIQINHSAGEYIIDMAHTNGIESFWSLLKRGYVGVYHYMSPKHLHRYVKEYQFRHNTSHVGTLDFIEMTIARMADKRLTYKGLTNGREERQD